MMGYAKKGTTLRLLFFFFFLVSAKFSTLRKNTTPKTVIKEVKGISSEFLTYNTKMANRHHKNNT